MVVEIYLWVQLFIENSAENKILKIFSVETCNGDFKVPSCPWESLKEDCTTNIIHWGRQDM